MATRFTFAVTSCNIWESVNAQTPAHRRNKASRICDIGCVSPLRRFCRKAAYKIKAAAQLKHKKKIKA